VFHLVLAELDPELVPGCGPCFLLQVIILKIVKKYHRGCCNLHIACEQQRAESSLCVSSCQYILQSFIRLVNMMFLSLLSVCLCWLYLSVNFSFIFTDSGLLMLWVSYLSQMNCQNQIAFPLRLQDSIIISFIIYFFTFLQSIHNMYCFLCRAMILSQNVISATVYWIAPYYKN
jgi:hypothetical protein